MKPNSIVPFIKEQFPAYIADSQTLLIPFMQAYYEWMQQDGNTYGVLNDLANLSSIDKSLVKFTEEFNDEYLSNFPKDILTDKALTIKHINDLYKAKGTPNAVKLLIQMILGKTSEIFYPSTQILKASDGTWIQDNSIMVSVKSGNIFDIVGKSVQVATSALIFSTIVERVRVTAFPNIYEVFLERKLIYDISKNTIISYNDVVAKSEQTIVKFNILNGGSNFSIGQIFEIKTALGFGTFVKVKSVDSLGAIKSLQIIKFGFGYESNFDAGLVSKSTQSNVLTVFPNLSETVSNIGDSGYINLVDYVDYTYVDTNYSGMVLSSFISNSTVDVDPNAAKVEVILGDKLKYPGYYNSVNGFLSDSIFLQDDYYYQAYSYVVKIDETLAKYKDKVESTVHPAGMKLFGEYKVENNYTINTQLKFILNFFRLVVGDLVVSQDSISNTFTKFLADFVSSIDDSNINFTKPLQDTFLSIDDSNIQFSKLLLDSTPSIDDSNFNVTKSLLDLLSNVDDTNIQFIKKLLDSTPSIDDSNINVTKYLNDTQSNIDSGGIFLNYYSDANYWDITYSEGVTTF